MVTVASCSVALAVSMPAFRYKFGRWIIAVYTYMHAGFHSSVNCSPPQYYIHRPNWYTLHYKIGIIICTDLSYSAAWNYNALD